MVNWPLALCVLFTCWGVFAFLRIVGLEVWRQKQQLEAEKQMQEDEAKRESLLPVATITPITCEPPPGPNADFQS